MQALQLPHVQQSCCLHNRRSFTGPAVSRCSRPRQHQHRTVWPCAATEDRQSSTSQESDDGPSTSGSTPVSTSKSSKASQADLQKEVNRFVRDTASTFAPRASGPTGKNPAYPGSTLYTVFEVQAWLGLLVGGLLSYNCIFPSDEPNIARLLGMWSIWMFTVPSLRARDCPKDEKDALNVLFLLIPLLNIAIPFFLKSFPVIFSADCIALAGCYFWKGVWGAPKSSQQS